MNSRSAWCWAFAASILFLALVAYERFFHRPAPGPEYLLPGFEANLVDAVQVISAGNQEVHVLRTNEAWQMIQPVNYPAQTASIEALLDALGQVIPATRLSSAQLRKNDESRADFGLETPRSSVVLVSGGGRQQILFGSLTAPGDQVFVQVVGHDGIDVVDAELLKLVPESSDVWRDTGLCTVKANSYDGILVSSGDGVLELKRENTNRTWRIVRPMQARADDAHIENLVQALCDMQVQQFVSDDPKADRESWGLQPPQLQITFVTGTNTLQALQFGKPVSGDAGLVYAVGRESTSVVTVRAEPLESWSAPPNDFRDRQILRLSRAVSSIDISNGEQFTLVNATNGTWQVNPQGFPADAATVQRFVDGLQNLLVTQFVKDVVAEPDLPAYGLATPRLRIQFNFQGDGEGQNGSSIGLDFGTVENGIAYVRRTDENAVYAVDAATLSGLPAAAGHFRKLDIWNFTEDQVAALRLQKGDANWVVQRNGQNQWVLAPGSQGIINPFALEETAHRLGELKAVVWTDWGDQDFAKYGLGPDAITLTVELKDGGRRSVQFGFRAPSSHVYASALIDGETWVFEFPTETFDLLETNLIKPSNLL